MGAERKAEHSALLLRKVLGPMRLQPIRVDVGRPYYRVSTAIDVVSLFEPDPEIDRDTGSNFLREWS